MIRPILCVARLHRMAEAWGSIKPYWDYWISSMDRYPLVIVLNYTNYTASPVRQQWSYAVNHSKQFFTVYVDDRPSLKKNWRYQQQKWCQTQNDKIRLGVSPTNTTPAKSKIRQNYVGFLIQASEQQQELDTQFDIYVYYRCLYLWLCVWKPAKSFLKHHWLYSKFAIPAGIS